MSNTITDTVQIRSLFGLDKTLNDVVPQLIPRDPVNIDGVKPGFNTIRSNIPTNESIHAEMEPTNNAPIAVFDGTEKKRLQQTSFTICLFSLAECDIHIPPNPKTGEFISPEKPTTLPITSPSSTYHPPASPNFPRLTPFTTLRRSSTRSNV